MTYSVAIKAKRAYETKGAKQAVENFDNVYGAYLGAWENYINATVEMNPKQKKVWESENGFRDADGKFIENDKERFIAKWAVKEGAERIKKIMLAENKTTIASAYNARDFDKVKEPTIKTPPVKTPPAPAPAKSAVNSESDADETIENPCLATVALQGALAKLGDKQLTAPDIASVIMVVGMALAKEHDVKIAGLVNVLEQGNVIKLAS